MYERQKERLVLFWGIGVGMNMPAIIKYPFRRMTYAEPKAVCARLDRGEAYAPEEIGERSICVDGDIREILMRIG